MNFATCKGSGMGNCGFMVWGIRFMGWGLRCGVVGDGGSPTPVRVGVEGTRLQARDALRISHRIGFGICKAWGLRFEIWGFRVNPQS